MNQLYKGNTMRTTKEEWFLIAKESSIILGIAIGRVAIMCLALMTFEYIAPGLFNTLFITEVRR